MAAVLAAVAAGIALVWLPAIHQRHDRAWMDAGHRAIAGVQLPAEFSEFHVLRDGSSTETCGDGTVSVRCFVAAGDPRDNVTAARAGFRPIATGPIEVSCGSDGGFAVAPDKCRLQVPVKDSELDVFVLARFHMPKRTPVVAEDFDGTVIQVVVAPRR